MFNVSTQEAVDKINVVILIDNTIIHCQNPGYLPGMLPRSYPQLSKTQKCHLDGSKKVLEPDDKGIAHNMPEDKLAIFKVRDVERFFPTNS